MGLSINGIQIKCLAIVNQAGAAFLGAQRGFSAVARPGAGVSNLTTDNNTPITPVATGGDFALVNLLAGAGNSNGSTVLAAAAPQIVQSNFVVAAATDVNFSILVLSIQ